MSSWTVCPVCGAIIGDPTLHILYHEVVMPQVLEEMAEAAVETTNAEHTAKAAATAPPGDTDAHH